MVSYEWEVCYHNSHWLIVITFHKGGFIELTNKLEFERNPKDMIVVYLHA